MKSICEAERVVRRSEYLIRVARVLDIPVIVTTQYASRLGPIHPSIGDSASDVQDKLTFSCWKDPQIRTLLKEYQRDQIVVVGVETHICVSLTVNDLLEQGFDVVVCPDALSSSTVERHKLGMERIRDAGAAPAHTESVVYEWAVKADDPSFTDLLKLTKEFH